MLFLFINGQPDLFDKIYFYMFLFSLLGWILLRKKEFKICSIFGYIFICLTPISNIILGIKWKTLTHRFKLFYPLIVISIYLIVLMYGFVKSGIFSKKTNFLIIKRILIVSTCFISATNSGFYLMKILENYGGVLELFIFLNFLLVFVMLDAYSEGRLIKKEKNKKKD